MLCLTSAKVGGCLNGEDFHLFFGISHFFLDDLNVNFFFFHGLSAKFSFLLLPPCLKCLDPCFSNDDSFYAA